MIRRDIPPECDGMPRGLIMRHLGIDPTETDAFDGTPPDLASALAALVAQVESEREMRAAS